MKRILSSILLLTILFTFSKCAIYENIHFHENGSVDYEMTIDASQVLSASSELMSKNKSGLPTDSIIYFADLMKMDSTYFSEDVQEDLKNVAPLALQLRNSPESEELKFTLFGTFKDTEALNKAFVSMKKLEQIEKEKKGLQLGENNGNMDIDNFFGNTKFFWDGNTLKRTVLVKEEEVEEIPDDTIDHIGSPSKMFFSKGKMYVKYHFPKKIKSINNENAMISQDGKTAIVEYSGSMLIDPTEELAIEISTE